MSTHDTATCCTPSTACRLSIIAQQKHDLTTDISRPCRSVPLLHAGQCRRCQECPRQAGAHEPDSAGISASHGLTGSSAGCLVPSLRSTCHWGHRYAHILCMLLLLCLGLAWLNLALFGLVVQWQRWKDSVCKAMLLQVVHNMQNRRVQEMQCVRCTCIDVSCNSIVDRVL